MVAPLAPGVLSPALPRPSPLWLPAAPASWPFRALLPWGESISDWHAWGAQMPSALAAASTVLRTRAYSPQLSATPPASLRC